MPRRDDPNIPVLDEVVDPDALGDAADLFADSAPGSGIASELLPSSSLYELPEQEPWDARTRSRFKRELVAELTRALDERVNRATDSVLEAIRPKLVTTVRRRALRELNELIEARLPPAED